MAWQVSTSEFSGSLEELCSLAGSGRIDLGALRLAEMVENFVCQEASSGGLDLDAATEFSLLLARLLQMKTRQLIPGRQEPEEAEEQADLDSLLSRVVEATCFGLAGAELARMAEQAERSRPHRGSGELASLPVPRTGASFGVAELAQAYLAAIRHLVDEPRPSTAHMARRALPLGAVAARVAELLQASRRLSLASLVEERSVAHLIATLLVLLHLCKAGVVHLEQPGPFDELWVEWIGEGTLSVSEICDWDW